MPRTEYDEDTECYEEDGKESTFCREKNDSYIDNHLMMQGAIPALHQQPSRMVWHCQSWSLALKNWWGVAFKGFDSTKHDDGWGWRTLSLRQAETSSKPVRYLKKYRNIEQEMDSHFEVPSGTENYKDAENNECYEEEEAATWWCKCRKSRRFINHPEMVWHCQSSSSLALNTGKGSRQRAWFSETWRLRLKNNQP